MIVDFLRQYQEELISEKIDIKEKIDLLESKINEEKKFVEVLDSSNKSFFSDFSPRDLNAKNREKADEVRLLISKYESEYELYDNRMKFIESRLDNIQALITSTKTNEAKTSSFSDDLVFRLQSVLEYISIDQQRATVELEAIIESLK